MAVTIKDIAKAAGVAHSTVSRALREHPAIAPDTIVRIKQHAEKLGYVPSAVARGSEDQPLQRFGSHCQPH